MPDYTKEQLVREIAYMGFKAAQNAYRLYPDNKHTFSDHSDLLIKEGLKLIAGAKWAEQADTPTPENK